MSRPVESAACTRCSGGTCAQCRTYARIYRLALRRALAQPGMERQLAQVGLEVAGGDDGGGRVVGGGMQARAETQALLFRLHNAVKHHRRVEGDDV